MSSDKSKPSVAFVAGGGAIKAYAFHVGVLRGLEEDGFCFRSGARWEPKVAPPGAREIDTYVGSSAGACVVAGVAAGYPAQELGAAILGTSKAVPTFGYRVMFAPVAPNPAKHLHRLAQRWRFGALKPHHLLDLGGLVSATGIERYFREHVLPTNRFADLAAKVFLVATQVNGSRKVVFGPTDSLTDDGYDPGCAYYDNVRISDGIAAAVSLPPLFVPYAIVNPTSGERFHYYDGEVREPLSVHVARDAGSDFVIASSIWRPYSFEQQMGSLAQYGMATLTEQVVHQAIEQKVRVERDRAEQFDRLLELIDTHGADHGLGSQAVHELKQQICALLRHRPIRALYVAPEPTDTEFFFHSSFRFNRRPIERCIDAGHRAYRSAIAKAPSFLAALDAATRAAR